MASFNINLNKTNTYDAIVIGSGITGGWAAKELCEKGLSTLVLEKGKMVKHIDDYPNAAKDAWEKFQMVAGLTNVTLDQKYR